MAWGNLLDRFGTRLVVLTGSIVLALSLALASQTTSLLAFQLTFGLLIGGSISAIFAPMMACVTGWFDTHRSLAVSLVSAGMGVAPVTVAPTSTVVPAPLYFTALPMMFCKAERSASASPRTDGSDPFACR